MKNILLKTIVLFWVSILMLSCKKQHSCFCQSIYVDAIAIPVYGTKKEAKQKCTAYETNGELDYYPDQGCHIIDHGVKEKIEDFF